MNRYGAFGCRSGECSLQGREHRATCNTNSRYCSRNLYQVRGGSNRTCLGSGVCYSSAQHSTYYMPPSQRSECFVRSSESSACLRAPSQGSGCCMLPLQNAPPCRGSSQPDACHRTPSQNSACYTRPCQTSNASACCKTPSQSSGCCAAASSNSRMNANCSGQNKNSDAISQAQLRNLNEFLDTARTRPLNRNLQAVSQCPRATEKTSTGRTEDFSNSSPSPQETTAGQRACSETRSALTSDSNNCANDRSGNAETGVSAGHPVSAIIDTSSESSTKSSSTESRCRFQRCGSAVQKPTSCGRPSTSGMSAQKPCAVVSAMPSRSPVSQGSSNTRPGASQSSRRASHLQRPCAARANLRPVQQGNSSSGQSIPSLSIGTSVRIVAIPDSDLPASARSPSRISAVVMYVTADGRYKLGTRQGIFGRLFSRDELDSAEKTLLHISDVPRKNITVREASALYSY